MTFEHAARRCVEEDRTAKTPTPCELRSDLACHLLPAFRERRLMTLTAPELERRRSTLHLSARTKNKLLIANGGIYRRAQRVYVIGVNPAAQIERLRERRQADIDVFTSEEVWVLGERAGRGDGSALRRRYIAALDRAASAGCASTTFATTVGTRVIAKADIVRVAAARQRVTSCAPRATLDRPPIKAGVPADE